MACLKQCLHACCLPACGKLHQLWRAEELALLQAVVPRLMASWERELDIMLKVGDAPIPLAQRLAGAGLQAGVPHKPAVQALQQLHAFCFRLWPVAGAQADQP